MANWFTRTTRSLRNLFGGPRAVEHDERQHQQTEQQRDQMEEQDLSQDGQPVGSIVDDANTSTSSVPSMHSTTPFAAALILKHTEMLVKSVSLNLLNVSMLLLQSSLITQQTYDSVISTPSSLSVTEKSAVLVNAIFTGLCVSPSRLSEYLDVLQPIRFVGEVFEKIRVEYDVETSRHCERNSEVTVNEGILIGKEVDEEFCRIRLHFGRVLTIVMRMVIEKMTLEEIKLQLSTSCLEYSDIIECIESPERLIRFIRERSNFTHFPILRALCEVFEVHRGTKQLEEFDEKCQQLYKRLLCQDFAKLAIEQHEQKSHRRIVFKAEWAEEATLHEFDSMLRQTFLSARHYIQLRTVISGCLAFVCEAPQWMLGALKIIVKNKRGLLSSLKITSVEIDGELVITDLESPVDTSTTENPEKCTQELSEKAAVNDEENDPELLRGIIKVKEVMEKQLRDEVHDLKRKNFLLEERLGGHQTSLAASSSEKSSKGETEKKLLPESVQVQNLLQKLEACKEISRKKSMEIESLKQQLKEKTAVIRAITQREKEELSAIQMELSVRTRQLQKAEEQQRTQEQRLMEEISLISQELQEFKQQAVQPPPLTLSHTGADGVQWPLASTDLSSTSVDEKPANDDQAYDVILSHAPEDAEFAAEIMARLQERAGASVYLTKHQFTDFSRTIERGYKIIIVLLSPDYVESHQCINEAQLALQQNINIGKKSSLLPVVYRRCTIPLFIRHLNCLDYTRFKDNDEYCENYFWKRLYAAIRRD